MSQKHWRYRFTYFSPCHGRKSCNGNTLWLNECYFQHFFSSSFCSELFTFFLLSNNYPDQQVNFHTHCHVSNNQQDTEWDLFIYISSDCCLLLNLTSLFLIDIMQFQLSYQIVDSLIWLGIRDMVNDLRKKKLKLRPVTYLSGTQGSGSNIPHGYMWSPHLVPKPKGSMTH